MLCSIPDDVLLLLLLSFLDWEHVANVVATKRFQGNLMARLEKLQQNDLKEVFKVPLDNNNVGQICTISLECQKTHIKPDNALADLICSAVAFTWEQRPEMPSDDEAAE